jgi:3-hydroxybutyryl-CoA dehydrogenase
VAPSESAPRVVAVIGAGTMGAGIAQVAAAAGHEVLLHDVAPGAAERAIAGIGTVLERLEQKGRISAADRLGAISRLRVVPRLADLAPAGLLIEVVVERLDVKQALFADLEAIVAPHAILASNTSSLSITEIAAGLAHPGRVVGMHFFNPAPVLPLVEVISGAETDPAVAAEVFALAAAWGKTPVHATSTPGFIVNRVARPFYGEAFGAYEEGAADPATIDALLRDAGGFRMGPFELTDLIGQDVNAAVSRSVWEALGKDHRFAPSVAQAELVAAGKLGRKTGEGWFSYADGAVAPSPSTAPTVRAPAAIEIHGRIGPLEDVLARLPATVAVTHRDPSTDAVLLSPTSGWVALPCGAELHQTSGRTATELARQRNCPVVVADLVGDPGAATGIAVAAGAGTPPHVAEEAIGLLQACGLAVTVLADIPGLVVARTLAMLVNIAADAVDAGVAASSDVDLAMRAGVNYPRGPLEWGAAIGPEYVVEVLRGLQFHDEQRYRVSPWLSDRKDAEELR